MNTVDRAVRVQRREQLLGRTHRQVDPPRADGSLLLPRSCRRTGAQGRHDRRRPGRCGSDSLPALASVGPRDRLERGVQLLQPELRRLYDRQRAESDDVEPAGWCLGSERRCSPPFGLLPRTSSVHADGDHPRRKRFAEPRHHRVGHVAVPIARSYTMTNLFGAFTGRAEGSNMGSAFRAVPTIAHLAVQERFVDVPAGASSLRATIGSPGDPAADLDLFVFNCTTGTCVLAGQNADGDRRRASRSPTRRRDSGRSSSTASTSPRGTRRTSTSTSTSRRRRSG